MRLYHGSDYIIKKPIYGYGNINNDYGMELSVKHVMRRQGTILQK